MNVTFTTFDAPDFVGGPNSWLRRVLPLLQRAGWRVRVLFFIERGSPGDCPCFRALSGLGIDCRSIPSSEPVFIQVRWLLQELADSPPGVFVINLAAAGYLAARWVSRAGIASIGILHSDDPFYEKVLTEFVTGPAGNCVSDMVCVSEFLSRQTQGLRTATTMHLIPYGVPVPKQTARAPDGKLRLIYVGRLVEEQKQILEVTRALCRVVRQVPDTEAVIYGNGPDRVRVIRCLEEENVGDRVRLGGQIENAQIQQVMLDAHVLVLLSDYEGLPIAMLEAMACGLVPVSLSIRSGVGQLIEHGITGFLVTDRGDDFVATIRRIAANPAQWSRISCAAREKIVAKYSDELNAHRWAELLSSRSAQSAQAEAVKRTMLRGISTLEFLNTTLSKNNDRAITEK